MSSDTMRAMVLEEPGGPLVLRDVPTPQPGPGEALLRVGACAVDRFDLAIRRGARERVEAFPHILGHEIAGEVVALGANVDTVSVGDRVASTLYLVCGKCRHCQAGRETICEHFGGHIGVAVPGGYAEYVVLPVHNLVAIADDMTFAEASVFANAIGTPYHALTTRMTIEPGTTVIITGAGGGVGLHAVQIAALEGGRVMAVDTSEERLARAQALGAEVVVDSTAQDLLAAALDWTDGRGVDRVLELVGPATMHATLPAMAKGGRMVIVGAHTGTEWEINPGDIYRNEWEIVGSRNVTAEELREVVELVASGKIKPVIDTEYPLERAEDLHHRVRHGSVIGRDVLIP